MNAVLHRPHIRKKYPLAEEDIEKHLSLLRNFAQVAEGTLTLSVVTSDPNDNHVLAAAVETNSDCIITGDQHLLELREHHGIQLLTPREFLTRLALPEQ